MVCTFPTGGHIKSKADSSYPKCPKQLPANIRTVKTRQLTSKFLAKQLEFSVCDSVNTLEYKYDSVFYLMLDNMKFIIPQRYSFLSEYLFQQSE